MSPSLLLPILLLVPLDAAAPAASRTSGRHTVPVEFTEHVNDYAEIHRIAAAAIGPAIISSNPEEILRQRWALAAAIRAARPSARPGDIFTPRVAAFFRGHIATVVRETGFDVAMVFEDLDEELLDEAGLEVNGTFPWAAGSFMWPSMLWRLPVLPQELEYRFVRRDLVLIDVRASLVVDILTNALPADDAEAQGKPSWHVCDVLPAYPRVGCEGVKSQSVRRSVYSARRAAMGSSIAARRATL